MPDRSRHEKLRENIISYREGVQKRRRHARSRECKREDQEVRHTGLRKKTNKREGLHARERECRREVFK